jgi:glycosyltransferase involved in cell wall biosynthesis
MYLQATVERPLESRLNDAPLPSVGIGESRGLRIWHDGADPASKGVNGVNATIWLLARHQANLGHDVTLLLRVQPSAAAISSAAASGIQLLFLGGGLLNISRARLDAALRNGRPDIVQMHSVFIPRQASLARQLQSRGIPYVTTPHGGFSAEVLRHNKIKKEIYAKLLERPRCSSAAVVTASIGEEADIRAFLGQSDISIRNMPVGIDVESLGTERWNQNFSPAKLVFLGRFDVYVKGIDLLLGIAGLMRDHEFHLYGLQDHATREWLRQIRCGCASNVFFHPPVYGKEKAQVLCDATMYIQMSRSESFGISIAEAMHLGVPCAIADQIHIAAPFRKHDLGLLLPGESAAAAMALTRALKAREPLLRWSQRAKGFALDNFDAGLAAQQHVALYREVLSSAKASVPNLSPRIAALT